MLLSIDIHRILSFVMLFFLFPLRGMESVSANVSGEVRSTKRETTSVYAEATPDRSDKSVFTEVSSDFADASPDKSDKSVFTKVSSDKQKMEIEKNDTKIPTHYIAPELWEQIKNTEKQYKNDLELHNQERFSSLDDKAKKYWRILLDYTNKLQNIALNAGKLMSGQSKLEYLEGDHYYKERKIIIKEMIETEKADPNYIRIEGKNLPLHVLKFNDFEFETYLLEQGADLKGARKTFEKEQEKETIRRQLEYRALRGEEISWHMRWKYNMKDN